LLKKFYFIFLFIPFILTILMLFSINQIENKDFIKYILVDLKNTLYIAIIVNLISNIYGISLAYIHFRFSFLFSNILDKLIVLTMIFPPFVLGILYSEFNIFNKYFFNEYGLILLLSLSNFTYSYIFTKTLLLSTNDTYYFQLKKLKFGELKIIKLYYLNIIFNSLLISSIFIFADTISEFGLTYYMGVDTFTTTLYQIWTNLYDINLGIFVLLIYFLFFLLFFLLFHNKLSNRKMFNLEATKHKKITTNKKTQILFIGLFMIPIIFGLIIPLFVDIKWLIITTFNLDILKVAFNSFLLSTIVSLLSLILIYNLIKYFWKNEFINNIILMYYFFPTIIFGVIFTYFIGVIKNYIIIDSFYLYFLFFIIAMVYKYLPLGYGIIIEYYKNVFKWFIFLDKVKSNIFKKIEIKFSLLKNVYFYAFILIFIDNFKEFTLNFILKPSEIKTLNVEIMDSYNIEIYYTASPYIFLLLLIILFVLNLKKER
jgi:iron(III) transport system permease protein